MTARSAALFAFLALAGCGSEGKPGLPDVNLPTYSSKTAPSLASCPTPKCLTVYVAPWCGYCRAATPLILKMRENLKALNIGTRIIVGQDQPGSLEDYARTFGPDTLMDMNNSLRLSGVPHFYVSDGSGAILKELAGYPMGVETPEEFAMVLDLPVADTAVQAAKPGKKPGKTRRINRG